MTQKFVPKGQSEAPTIKLPEPLEKLFAFFPASLRGKKYSYLLSFHVEGKKDKINDKFQEIINKSTYFPMADEDWQIMQGFIDKANLLGYNLYLPLPKTDKYRPYSKSSSPRLAGVILTKEDLFMEQELEQDEIKFNNSNELER